jgi:hypothetical protein
MYLTDPKDGKKSVTLTFVVTSFLLFAGFACAGALGHAQNVNSLSELFYASAALYFGRRVKVGSKTFEMNQGNDNETN